MTTKATVRKTLDDFDKSGLERVELCDAHTFGPTPEIAQYAVELIMEDRKYRHLSVERVDNHAYLVRRD